MTQRTADHTRAGIIFILSAPSGAGKTTIARDVVQKMADIRIGISHTTRPPRSREKDGRDYHFVTEEEFFRIRDEGAFLETALVHDNHYGTHRDEVIPYISAGTDVILDIDVQGAALIKKTITAVGIFILPPSMDELIRRLKLRDTETDDVIGRRIENARREVAEAVSYDYLVINNVFSQAVADVMTIITAVRMEMDKNRGVIDEFIRDNG